MLFNVCLDKLWYQVADTVAPSEGSPDFRGRDVVGDPLVHQVDVVLVFPQHLGFVNKFLSITSSPRDAYESIVLHDSDDVLTLPQVGDAEGLQCICPTQQLYLWHIFCFFALGIFSDYILSTSSSVQAFPAQVSPAGDNNY